MKNFVWVMALCMAFVACSDEEGGNGDDNVRHDIALGAEEKEAAEAAEDFAYRAFAQVCDGTGNVVYSPLSSQMALSMTVNAASGDVQEEALGVICPGSSLAALNSLNGRLNSEFPRADKKTVVCVANSMWLDHDLNACAGLRSILSEHYGAEILGYDADAREAAAEKVNKWVSEATHGEICKIADADLIGVATLVNAVYFKGEWADKFKRENTKKDFFTNCDGMRSQVMFMNGWHNGAYGEYEGTKYGRIYFGNGSYAITFVLPAEGKSMTEGLDDFRNNHDSERYDAMLKSCDLNVKVPRFTSESRHNLKDIGGRLGLGSLVNGQLPGLVDGNTLAVKAVVQQCKFAMDEDGATASSSTMVSADPTSLDPAMAFTLVLDHPFAYMITETSTGTILFMGSVARL